MHCCKWNMSLAICHEQVPLLCCVAVSLVIQCAVAQVCGQLLLMQHCRDNNQSNNAVGSCIATVSCCSLAAALLIPLTPPPPTRGQDKMYQDNVLLYISTPSMCLAILLAQHC